jgi:hypothetical protein
MPRKPRGLSGRERMADQGLYQAVSTMRWQYCHVLDQPIAVAALHPAAGAIGPAPEYRGEF